MSTELRTPDLKGFLHKHLASVQEVAAASITPERMARLVCAAASREPRLAECTPLSILRSMMSAAELGLEVCSGLNEAYLIPRYNGKAKKMEATFLPGYQGLIRLARDSGSVRNIEARVVYEQDQFEYEQGTNPHISHKPSLKADRGAVLAVYAVAFMPDGSTTFELMLKSEIDAIMDRGKTDTFSPWKTDWSEMARKTVVRRLAKYLPKKSHALAKALEIQAKAEIGETFEGEVIRPGDSDVPTEPVKFINEDGVVVFHWTDSDRDESKSILDSYSDTMDKEGVPEDGITAIRDEFRLLIGHPDLSQNTWHNRLSGRVDRLIKKV